MMLHAVDDKPPPGYLLVQNKLFIKDNDGNHQIQRLYNPISDGKYPLR